MHLERNQLINTKLEGQIGFIIIVCIFSHLFNLAMVDFESRLVAQITQHRTFTNVYELKLFMHNLQNVGFHLTFFITT